jgi:hypothetical protein
MGRYLCAVRPINREISADALEELMRDLRKRCVGLHVFDAAGECVVERGFLAAEVELLVSASHVAGGGGLEISTGRFTTLALVSCLSP